LRKAPPPLGRSDETLARLFETAGIDPQGRAETLSNQQWLALTQAFTRIPDDR